MSKNIEHVQHLKSKMVVDGSPKLPNPSALTEGEIAVNYAEGYETLSIKNESGDVKTFSSDEYYTEKKLGSAFTGANSAVTVTDVLASINEVEVNSGDTPIGSGIEIWVDESVDPEMADVYTKAETDDLLAEKLDASAYTENNLWVSGTGTNSLVQNGGDNVASGNLSIAEGYHTQANNVSEHSIGQYNTSSSASTTFGDSGNTLFSIGNGNADNARHNAFEVRQNGDIYVTSGGSTILLQDKIGDIPSVSEYADSVLYNDTTHYVEFYHGTTAGTKVYEFDASAFIVDGMVDDVRIEDVAGSGTCLVIDFNTASGKQDINIPISDIFDASNYYTKQDIDDKLGSGFTVSSVTEVIESNERVTSQALNDLNENKQDVLTEGRAIDITNNTISLDLPISAGTGTNAIIENDSSNIASSNYSHAEGYATSATSETSHAEGTYTKSNGIASHAEGSHTIANSNYSHAEGYATSATSSYSHAEGYQTKANGQYSHAEGNGTQAIGSQSHAEGNSTKASGVSSHAEGTATSAMSNSSHAEGNNTKAIGELSHSEGVSTIASGSVSHAEGQYTTANGVLSHTEGSYTVANGAVSHVEGNYTVTNNQYEHASGYYNISVSATTDLGDSGNTLFSVGNGTENARHNAFEIRQNGDIYIVNKDGNDVKLQDEIGNITVDQTIDSGTSASTNAVSTSAVYGFVTSYTPSITVDQVLDNTTSASTNPVSSKAVYDAVTDNELVWTNAYVALSGVVSSHTEDTTVHVTSSDKTAWNGAATNSHTHSNKSTLDDISSSDVTNWNSAYGKTSGITATTSAINSLTGSVGSMAFENTNTYSSATEVNTALGNKADSSDIANFFDDAKYEDSGTSKVINFYHGNTIKATINADDFIVDGMIESVSAGTSGSTTVLDIKWNTDAGSQETILDIGDMFEADNYYTTAQTSGATELSTAFGDKLSTSDFNAYSGAVDTAIGSKAAQSDLNTLSGTVTGHTADTNIHLTTTEKTNLDSLATNIAAISGITSTKVGNWDSAYEKTSGITATTAAINSLTGSVGSMAFQNTSSYSSATEVNTALAGKSDTGHTHSISDVTNLQTTLNGKANTATTLSGYGITNAYTKTEIDNKIGDIETLLAAI